MLREQLFTQYVPDEACNQEVERISPVADYALEELPAELSAVREGEMSYDELNSRQEAVIEDAALAIGENTDPEAAEVTQLDLHFMRNGRLPLGDDMDRLTPAVLLDTIRQQHQRFGLPTIMDYELIIDVNAREFYRTGQRDIRTYTDGDVGLDERDFYVGHYNTESLIKAIAFGVREIVERPDEVDVEENLRMAAMQFAEFGKDMRQYGKMPPESFTSIRPYLAQYPDGTSNASGAFMPSVQLAELALHAPTEEFQRYVNHAVPYFPRWSRSIMQEWSADSANGNNLDDMINDGRLEVTEEGLATARQIVNHFKTFRVAHRNVAEKIIVPPEGKHVVHSDLPRSLNGILELGEQPVEAEVEGALMGTGGFNIGHLLTNGIYRMGRLAKSLGRADNARG